MSGTRNVMLAVLMAAACGSAARADDAYFKLGATFTSLANQGQTFGDGVIIPGSDYRTNGVTHATLTGGYFFMDDFAVEASVTSPATTRNIPSGTMLGMPNFGNDTFVTTDLTLTYHPLRGSILSPYVGAGVRHHFTTKNVDGPLVTNFHIGSGTGAVLQGGLDYNFSKYFAAFIEVKKAFYNVIGTGNIGPEAIRAHAKLDPVSVTFGGAWRFGGGETVAKDDAAPSGNWFLRLGATMLALQDKLNLSVGGAPFPGAKLDTNNHYTPSFQIGYRFYDHLAAVFTAGLPPTIDAGGGGTASALGKLSQVTYGPTALTIQYRPFEEGFFRPYVGFGASYMIVFKSTDAGVLLNTHMTNDLAPVVEVGADFMVTESFGFYAEAKKAWLSSRTTGTLMGAPVVGDAAIHPLVLSLGTIFRF